MQGGQAAESLRQKDGDADMLQGLFSAAGRRSSLEGLLFLVYFEKEGKKIMLTKPLDSIGFVSKFDPEVAAMMQNEFTRQQDGLELIASENFAWGVLICIVSCQSLI